ncbi:MAG: RagB/SusD family nutrient uptake outer membrane protein [Labilibaculum sp.]|nr:RagB/SusD family nutrient uptake outer membrane protein [Labilibaculum sp.]MBI9057196.1 RagB/SusD family nutrient uptake outer membrane protein [Labilibaculum sp.]
MKTLNMKFSIIMAVCLLFTACESFLDEPISKSSSVVPSTIEDLEALIIGDRDDSMERNYTYIFGTDDYGFDKALVAVKPGAYAISGQIAWGLWDEELMATSGDSYWTSEFKRIFVINSVLYYLEEVSGTEEEKKQLSAEAHFWRAYMYFNLVNTYCLPYSAANLNELGLPLRKTTSFEESLERASLEETYNFIKADLDAALTLDVKLEKGFEDKNRTWRASDAGVNAFAARFYLAMNDYTNALKYADAALALHSDLVDYNTEMRYSDIDYSVTIQGQTIDPQLPYLYDEPSDANKTKWKELYVYKFLRNGFAWYSPSEDLLASYDQTNDLRYRYHIVEDYSFVRDVNQDVNFSRPGYVFFGEEVIASGPTVPEMLLTKAECEARNGDYNVALNTVNKLRAVRMAGNINLTAGSKAEAIGKILEERRRELPFTSRWMDVRRYNSNDDSSDDVTITRDFYEYNIGQILEGQNKTYTLEPNSRRFAIPIPEEDIVASNGAIKQNTY